MKHDVIRIYDAHEHTWVGLVVLVGNIQNEQTPLRYFIYSSFAYPTFDW